jgi:hypothetical protein
MTTPNLPIDPKLQAPDSNPLYGSESTGSSNAVESNFQPPEDIKALQQEVEQAHASLEDDKFLNLSIQAFEASDKFFNSSIRPTLDDSTKAYKNEHSSRSAYGFDGNPENNSIYRPKTRSILTKQDAACAAAFFSNLDVVSIEPENPSDKGEALSAAIVKALLNYRLTKFIPWYQICLGGFKDAKLQGLVIGHVFWDIKRRFDGKIKEKPMVELIPLENFRFDPNADWTDIVNGSPYLIVLQPTYIGEVLDTLESGMFNGCPIAEGITDADITASFSKDNATTQKVRNNGQDPLDGSGQGAKPNEYQSVLIQFHIHRISGEDWIWYTLNNTKLLTKPVPLEDVYFHGKRPFVVGSYDVEPHTAYVTPFPEVLRPTQEEMNILANQRRTNVDMAMNRKWRVDPQASDRFDPNALLSNESGSIIFAKENEISPLDQPDVTSSSFQEQVLLDKDFDDLAGNFNPQQPLTQRTQTDGHRTNQMLNASANMTLEAMLKCYTQTFVEPVLRMLVLLEQFYETDEVIIGLAGQKAGLFQKFNGQLQWTTDAHKMAGAPFPQASGSAPMPSPGPQQQPGQMPGQPQMAPPGAPPGAGQPQTPSGVVSPPPAAPITGSSLPSGLSIESLLNKELTIRVNVGLNATDPTVKSQKFVQTIMAGAQLAGVPASLIFDLEEVENELFALNGYGDGKRFLKEGFVDAIQQAHQAQMQMKLKEAQIPSQTRLQIARESNMSREKIKAAELEQNAKELHADNLQFAATHSADMHQMQLDQEEAQRERAQQQPPQT